MNQVTTNFFWDEFKCHDGTPVPQEFHKNVIDLCNQLEILRLSIGKEIHINCGYRTLAHNEAVGGARNSQHLVGKAADITVESISPRQLHDHIEMLIREGKMIQGGLGLYPTFVHYDIRGTRARW